MAVHETKALKMKPQSTMCSFIQQDQNGQTSDVTSRGCRDGGCGVIAQVRAMWPNDVRAPTSRLWAGTTRVLVLQRMPRSRGGQVWTVHCRVSLALFHCAFFSAEYSLRLLFVLQFLPGFLSALAPCCNDRCHRFPRETSATKRQFNGEKRWKMRWRANPLSFLGSVKCLELNHWKCAQSEKAKSISSLCHFSSFLTV